jgi:hypothetical protein
LTPALWCAPAPAIASSEQADSDDAEPDRPPPSYSEAPAAFGSEPTPPPSERPETLGSYRHDGFYMRLALGAARVATSLDSSDLSGHVAGGGAAFDLAIGGTVSSGFVVGGGFFLNGGQGMSSHRVESDGVDVLDGAAADFAEVSFGLIGPFIDWYIDPEGGLHALAAVGVGFLDIGPATIGDVTLFDAHGVGGAAAMLGIGYEFWIASEWSLGLVSRVMAGRLRGRDEEGVEWDHRAFVLPSLLFAATYQ